MFEPSPPAALQALRAHYVFPVSSPPIDGGYVTFRDFMIWDVGTKRPDCPIHDLGDVAILPGLVNAHTHLEFSDLTAPLGTPGMSLPDWIRLVIAERGGRDSNRERALASALRESVNTGTTALGEIATQDWRNTEIARTVTPSFTMFYESIGPTADRVDKAIVPARTFLAKGKPGPWSHFLPGLSPHAPYTVHSSLLTSLVALAQEFQAPLAMHVAESREELELLRSGTGPFRDLLVDLNSWDGRADSRCRSITDCLQQLARAPSALVVHGNYLAGPELELLAAHREHMAVIYCPRTHHFFRHEPYPLAEMIEMGVAVALGTDSRASNPDLDMLAEMRFVAEHHPDVRPSFVLKLGTLAGAAALGQLYQRGALQAGKRADFAIVQLPSANARDPRELLFDPHARVVETWIAGRRVTAGNS